MTDETETVALRRRRPTVTQDIASNASRSHRLTAASPSEALLLEEIARIRIYALFSMVMYAGAAAGFPLLGGNIPLRNVVIAMAGVGFTAGAYVFFSLRDPGRYRQGVIAALAVVATIVGYSVVLYWGIGSAAPATVALGLYFFNRSQSGGAALLI